MEYRTAATLHSVSDLVSNEESKHLRYKKLGIKARWWLHDKIGHPVDTDMFASQIAGLELPHFNSACTLFCLCKF